MIDVFVGAVLLRKWLTIYICFIIVDLVIKLKASGPAYVPCSQHSCSLGGKGVI